MINHGGIVETAWVVGVSVVASLPEHRPISLYSSFSFCEREKRIQLYQVKCLEVASTSSWWPWLKWWHASMFDVLGQCWKEKETRKFLIKVLTKGKEDSFWSKPQKQKGGAITLWINDRGPKFSAPLLFCSVEQRICSRKFSVYNLCYNLSLRCNGLLLWPVRFYFHMLLWNPAVDRFWFDNSLKGYHHVAPVTQAKSR